MAETTADVRRDIELTRERMSATLEQLERKINVKAVVREHPWPALALALGAGFLLSGSRADVKAAAATVAATKGAGGKIGTVLDELVAGVMASVTQAVEQRVVSFVDELKTSVGARTKGASRARRPARPRGASRPAESPGADVETISATALAEGAAPNMSQEWQSARAD